MDFLTPQRGWLATTDGAVRRTDDGARTWRLVRHNFRVIWLEFISSRRGWALTENGKLLTTKNGGGTWSLKHSFPSRHGPVIDFVSGRVGWAGVEGRLLQTRDGGRTWQRRAGPCGRFAFYIGGVSFLDVRRGYLACGGQPATDIQAKDVYLTRDGGRSWRLRSCLHFIPRSHCRGRLPSVGQLSELAFSNERIGVFTASRGGIARTVDGGRRWFYTLFLDDEDYVVAVSWASATTVYALRFHDAILLRSRDAGRHWRRVR